ncbi:MAG: hypothetical protein IKQ54_01720 [Oscillospiraceae bacterium]|nr:hypothetical protein [Oscillospiraceae bacterium]
MKKHIITRRIPALLAAVLLGLGLCLPASATDGGGDFQGDIDYVGEVDPETGFGYKSSDLSGRIPITDTMLYDSAKGNFVFPIGANSELLCSAADGMLLTDVVTLSTVGSPQLSVYRNGEAVDLSAESTLKEPGEYTVYLGSSTGTRICGFTILPPVTNLIHGYSVPEGFAVREVLHNGEQQGYDRYYADMETEGEYEVSSRCLQADRTYTLRVTIDRTPPELVLSGNVGEDGRVRGPVTVSNIEEDTILTLERDGRTERLTASDGTATIRDTGTYRLVASDAAGNSSSYQFTILLYLDSSAFLFVFLTLAIIASVFLYALRKRRKFKVR